MSLLLDDASMDDDDIQALLDRAEKEGDMIKTAPNGKAQLYRGAVMKIHENALKIAEREWGADDSTSVEIRDLLVASSRDAGEISQAIAYGNQNLLAYTKSRGPKDLHTLDAQKRLAEC